MYLIRSEAEVAKVAYLPFTAQSSKCAENLFLQYRHCIRTWFWIWLSVVYRTIIKMCWKPCSTVARLHWNVVLKLVICHLPHNHSNVMKTVFYCTAIGLECGSKVHYLFSTAQLLKRDENGFLLYRHWIRTWFWTLISVVYRTIIKMCWKPCSTAPPLH